MPEIAELMNLADRSEAYLRLAVLYQNGTSEFRELVRGTWDFGAKWDYPDQRRLACRKNERHSCEERIRATLIYDAIEDFKREEIREKLIAWAVVYHSCRAAGIEPEDVFSQAAKISSPQTAQAMLAFIRRAEADKSMEAFMISKEMNADGEFEFHTDRQASSSDAGPGESRPGRTALTPERGTPSTANLANPPKGFLADLTSGGEFLLLAWTIGICLLAEFSILKTASQLPVIGKLTMYAISAALVCAMFLLCTPRRILPKNWLESPRRRKLTISILSAIIGMPMLVLAVIETYQDGWALDAWTLAYPAGPGLLMILAIRWWGETDDSLKTRWFRLLLPVASTILWSIACFIVAYVVAGGPRLR
jgi:hypothetical protein